MGKSKSTQQQENKPKGTPPTVAAPAPATAKAEDPKPKPAPESNKSKKISYFSEFLFPIIALIIGGLYIVKTTIFEGPEMGKVFGFTVGDTAARSKLGIAVAIGAFCVFALCEFPDTLNRRPTPVFWRLVLLAGLCYMLGLAFLSFHTVDEARQYMRVLDPKLGVPLPERSYAADCRVYTPEDPTSKFRNIRDAIVDEFFIGHALGWYVKSMLFRDTGLSFFCSALFETMELTFRHILPNFYECWWDSIVLDLIITNTLGIVCGRLTLRLLGLREYNWIGYRPGQPWYRWEVFASPLRFIRFVFLLAMTEVVELCVFTLKAHLWIPPPHWIVITRLFIVAFVVAAALNEYHKYVTVKSYTKWGPHSWVCIGIIFFEVLLTVKWNIGVDLPPFPDPVKYSWMAVGALLLTFFCIHFPARALYLRSKRSNNNANSKKNKK